MVDNASDVLIMCVMTGLSVGAVACRREERKRSREQVVGRPERSTDMLQGLMNRTGC